MLTTAHFAVKEEKTTESDHSLKIQITMHSTELTVDYILSLQLKMCVPCPLEKWQIKMQNAIPPENR